MCITKHIQTVRQCGLQNTYKLYGSVPYKTHTNCTAVCPKKHIQTVQQCALQNTYKLYGSVPNIPTVHVWHCGLQNNKVEKLS